MTGREGGTGPRAETGPEREGRRREGRGRGLGRERHSKQQGRGPWKTQRAQGRTDTERLTSQTQTEGPPAAEDRGGDRDTGRQWEAGPDGWGGGRMKRDTLREMGRGEPHITKRLLSARPGV